MAEGNISQEFRLKEIDQTRNYFIKKIKQNRLISKKHKEFVNYNEYFILASTKYISISVFASLVGVLVDIASSVVGKKIVQ